MDKKTSKNKHNLSVFYYILSKRWKFYSAFFSIFVVFLVFLKTDYFTIAINYTQNLYHRQIALLNRNICNKLIING